MMLRLEGRNEEALNEKNFYDYISLAYNESIIMELLQHIATHQ
jgi:hypothetical protein